MFLCAYSMDRNLSVQNRAFLLRLSECLAKVKPAVVVAFMNKFTSIVKPRRPKVTQYFY